MIAQRCMEEKVVFAPGNVLSASQSATSFLRFDVAQLSDKRIFARHQKSDRELGAALMCF
jgi:hypothetical protein